MSLEDRLSYYSSINNEVFNKLYLYEKILYGFDYNKNDNFYLKL